MNFFIKDFCETVQARVVIFGMQVGNDAFIVGLRPSLLLLRSATAEVKSDFPTVLV